MQRSIGGDPLLDHGVGALRHAHETAFLASRALAPLLDSFERASATIDDGIQSCDALKDEISSFLHTTQRRTVLPPPLAERLATLESALTERLSTVEQRQADDAAAYRDRLEVLDRDRADRVSSPSDTISLLHDRINSAANARAAERLEHQQAVQEFVSSLSATVTSLLDDLRTALLNDAPPDDPLQQVTSSATSALQAMSAAIDHAHELAASREHNVLHTLTEQLAQLRADKQAAMDKCKTTRDHRRLHAVAALLAERRLFGVFRGINEELEKLAAQQAQRTQAMEDRHVAFTNAASAAFLAGKQRAEEKAEMLRSSALPLPAHPGNSVFLEAQSRVGDCIASLASMTASEPPPGALVGIDQCLRDVVHAVERTEQGVDQLSKMTEAAKARMSAMQEAKENRAIHAAKEAALLAEIETLQRELVKASFVRQKVDTLPAAQQRPALQPVYTTRQAVAAHQQATRRPGRASQTVASDSSDENDELFRY